MPFNSLEYFLLFLPLVALIYFAGARVLPQQAGTVWLILASLFFYGYASKHYLPLLCLSILFNFLVGTLLCRGGGHSPRTKSVILAAGIGANLVALGYSKYANFFIETVNQAAHTSLPLREAALPLAISFYTFQQIAFLADCAQGKVNKPGILDYTFFVLFFPQLIAGPILRYAEIVPQLRQQALARVNWENMARGLFVFAAGLFKKVVIADSFGAYALEAASGRSMGFIDAWLTSLCYTFQLYYDFSGYSDMAIGAALLFNIRLPVNFNSPYQAADIQDFWRRWHMTLSRWLRDYLYIPLGGSRQGTARTLTNIFITFLLGGIWHGAGWTFVVWGGLHGAALALHRAWRMTGRTMNAFWGRLCTFLFVNFAWVYFQSPSIGGANRIIKAMVGLDAQQPVFREIASVYAAWKLVPPTGLTLAAQGSMLVFALGVFIMPNTMQALQLIPYAGRWSFRTNQGFALLMSLLLTISLMTFMGSTGRNEFIYFQF